ncbi:M23 family metallopeptidase [Pusillimonas sp.]|uniref:M23 family metallopeptidase n=1 Tax=Pusillimonas sp. TaxID=3040095 RepID=UPI0037C58FF8
MRVVLTKGWSSDSNSKGIRAPVAALLAFLILGVSAGAGAWVYSSIDASAHAADKPLDLHTPLVIGHSQDQDTQGQFEALAAKLGDLQAKIIEIDGLSRRVAEVSGIPYTDPEIQAGLDQAAPPIMDYIGDAELGPLKHKMSFDTGSTLARQVDSLRAEVLRQKDWYRMMDLALTRRAGVEASLPSLMPVNYPYLSSSFGWRRHPISGRHVMHEGLDFAAPKGTPIYAASGGVVTFAGYKSGYGKMVEINHGNDLNTRYAHASKLKVKAGDIVERGQEIAAVGSTGHSTGPHLHFEVRMAGHPLDPVLFLEKPEATPTLLTDAGDHLSAVASKVR